jgi:hypothetical protein
MTVEVSKYVSATRPPRVAPLNHEGKTVTAALHAYAAVVPAATRTCMLVEPWRSAAQALR